MTPRWVARPYQSGDEDKIIELRKLVFEPGEEQRNTTRYWYWEYRDGPAGHATIWVAAAGENIVGHYAVRPVKMLYCGSEILGSTSIDAMTHPDFRREAVFATLGRSTYAEAEREGAALTYIFPREISMKGTIEKFNWEYVCALPVFAKPLDASGIVDRLLPTWAVIPPVRFLSRLLVRLLFRPAGADREVEHVERWIDRFDVRMDAFWARVAPRYVISVTRDSTYLNWRYFDNPGRVYRALIAEQAEEVVAYLVVRCLEQSGLSGGMIVDLGALPGHELALASLLDRAERFFRERGMDVMVCLVNGEERHTRLLRNHGFWPLPGGIGFKRWYFGCRVNSPAVDPQVCAQQSNWFLTFGDTDVI